MQSHKWPAPVNADEDLHIANCIMTMLRQIDQNKDQFAQEISLSLPSAVLIQLGTGMPLPLPVLTAGTFRPRWSDCTPGIEKPMLFKPIAHTQARAQGHVRAHAHAEAHTHAHTNQGTT